MQANLFKLRCLYVYVAVYLTSVEHSDNLAEFAEWHSICLMSLCKLKTTKIKRYEH